MLNNSANEKRFYSSHCYYVPTQKYENSENGGVGWAKWWRFRLGVRLEHSAEIIAKYLLAENNKSDQLHLLKVFSMHYLFTNNHLLDI